MSLDHRQMTNRFITLVFEVPTGTDPATLDALLTRATPARRVESFDGHAVAALRAANARRAVASLIRRLQSGSRPPTHMHN